MLAALALTVLSQEVTMKEIELGMLMTGTTAMPANAQELQGQHLKHLEGLWQSGKALAVGPLENGKGIRGLVIMDAATADAKKWMADDPFVKLGVMNYRSYRWFAPVNLFKKGPAFLDIAPYWFAFLHRPVTAPVFSPEDAQKFGEGHMANIRRMGDLKLLLAAGPVSNSKKLRGIFVFRGTATREEIEREVAQDPLIQKGSLRMTLYRWFTAKGTL